jgi:hypothetical protein
MNTRMKYVISLPIMAVAILAGVALYSTSNAKAAETANSSLIQTIAQKFGLSQDDVQKTVDDYRSSNRATRQADQDAKLNQAVTDGVISSDQKNLIISKRNEIRATQQNGRDEMQKWMSDNGIDHSKLQSYMGNGAGGRGGSGMGRGK